VQIQRIIIVQTVRAHYFISRGIKTRVIFGKLSNENHGVSMNKKYIGIALIIVGVALAIWGFNIYDSAGSKITRAINGDAPIEAWLGMVAGAICVVIGALKLK